MIPAYLSPLFNHLWQSTLFAAAVGLLVLALKKNHAQARHRLRASFAVRRADSGFESGDTRAGIARAAGAGRVRHFPAGAAAARGHRRPGEYDCQVTVLDPTDRKAAFWRAPVLLVQ